MPNNRIFYAVQSAAIAPLGSTTYTAIRGLQSLGVTTRFNLGQVFEIGQISLYDQPEDLPDIEVTTEKTLDGNPLVYHLATQGATSATLVGRSAMRCTMGVSIFGDTQNSASGTPVAQMVCSGLYVSTIGYTLPTQGQLSENITFVGNNKYWSSFTAPAFVNTDAPAYASGVMRRQDVNMDTWASGSVFPTDIPGINSSGYNPPASNNNGYAARIQNVRINTNLGRQPLYQLGQRGVFYRYAEFPVQVSTDIEVLATDGDNVNAYESQLNVFPHPMKIFLGDGTIFDLGQKNKLTSVTYGGADANQQGSNATQTYSYLNYNDLAVINVGTDPTHLAG